MATSSFAVDKIKCEDDEQTISKALETNLLEQLKITYDQDKCISDDLLESFFFLYKNPLLESLNQLDKHDQMLNNQLVDANDQDQNDSLSLVTLIKGKLSSRCVYKVKGSKKDITYYILEGINYCTCPNFKFQVLRNCENLHCKHVILIKLLKAMNRITIKIVDDDELVKIIKQIQ